MLQRWRKAITPISIFRSHTGTKFANAGTRHTYAKVAAAPLPTIDDDHKPQQPLVTFIFFLHYHLLQLCELWNELVIIWCCCFYIQVNLDKMFWSKPCSLALPRDSPMRVEEPDYQGIKRFFLRLMLFYSKQSRSIRGANVVYQRIISQVDKPPIYEGPISSFLYPKYYFIFVPMHDMIVRIIEYNLKPFMWPLPNSLSFCGNWLFDNDYACHAQRLTLMSMVFWDNWLLYVRAVKSG